MGRRKYRPFLIYNPKRGWGFYVSRGAVSPLTHKNIGTRRKVMRETVGWFNSAEMAAVFEARSRRVA